MSTVQKTTSVNRWAGPIVDVIDAGRLAIGTLADWIGTQPESEVEVALPDGTYREPDLAGLDRRLDARDLPAVRSLRIRVGGDVGPLCLIHLQSGSVSANPQPAVSIEVTGPDDDAVDGLRLALTRIFARGRQQPPSGGVVALVVLAAVGGLLLALYLPVWLGYGSTSGNGVRIHGGGVAIAWLIGSIGALGIAFVLLMHPVLELLPPGGRTRRSRLATWAWSIFVVLFGLIVTIYFSTRP